MLTAIALFLDFRSRIGVALFVAITLGIGRYSGFIERWPKSKFLGWLGKVSYAVFLVHFPICMVINGLFDKYAPHTPAIQFFGIVIAWLTSTAGGTLFYYQVECRAQRLLVQKRRT